MPLPTATSAHRCGACKTSFPAPELLAEHQRNRCAERSRRFRVVPLAHHSRDSPEKRLKLSATTYVPLSLKFKKRIDTEAQEVRRRKIPRDSSLRPCDAELDERESRVPVDGLRSDRLRHSVCPGVAPVLEEPRNHLLPQEAAPRVEAGVFRRRQVDLQVAVASAAISYSEPESLDPKGLGNVSDNLAAATSSPAVSSRDGPTNAFGLRKRYYGPALATHDPDDALALGCPGNVQSEADSTLPTHSSFGPFPNLSSFELGEWCISGDGQITMDKLQKLSRMAKVPGFSEDISKTNWAKIFDTLGSNKDELKQGKGDHWMDDDGWKETPVSIPVHIAKATEYHTVGTLYHRSIVSIVRQKIAQSPDIRQFHFDPYELLWQPDPSAPPMRVHSEMYSSDAFLKAHRDLQASPAPPNCDRPRVVAGLMFWSDETTVSEFSQEKLWPCYMCFANESKYRRCKPTSDLCHQVAYFDQLSDDFKDYAMERGQGKVPNFKALMTQCKGETMHAQWEIILDEELRDAIENGIVIMCQDGIERRFYIRIFTYSADYPEKILIASMRQNGHCPCPRCLVTHEELDQLGTPADMAIRRERIRKDGEAHQTLVKEARRLIHQDGKRLGHKEVEELMFPHSLHPIENAFSSRLSELGFDIFAALVVDLLHEFEIGVWKRLFIHLIRILAACDNSDALIHELDKRFRMMPTFGKSIRRFATNVSAFKRKAARDYEDLLQCAIFAFEGLVPEATFSKVILSILFTCAEWHALAKLRMHTDVTLQMLEETTTKLGEEFRTFIRDVCSHIRTTELAQEVAARRRREEKKVEQGMTKAEKDAEKETKRQERELDRSQKEAKKEAKKAEKAAKKAKDDVGKEAKRVAREAKRVQTEPIKPTAATSSAKDVPKKRGRGRPKKHAAADESSVGASGGPSSSSLPTLPVSTKEKGRGRAGKANKAEGPMFAASSTVEGLQQAPEAKQRGRPKTNRQVGGATASENSTLNVPALRRGRSANQNAPSASSAQGEDALGSADTGSLPVGPSTSEVGVAASGADLPKDGPPLEDAADPPDDAVQGTGRQSSKAKFVCFSINFPKFHFLGDYASTIRLYGTTDSYSSESASLFLLLALGELMHRLPKRWYKRSSKKNTRKGVLKYERKVGRVRDIRKRMDAKNRPNLSREAEKRRAEAQRLDIHHYIGSSEEVWVSHLLPPRFSSVDADATIGSLSEADPLAVPFFPDLRIHLLPKVISHVRTQRSNLPVEGEAPRPTYSDSYEFDSSKVSFKDDRIYSHKVLRVKYTSYDTRRLEEVVRVGSENCNVMIPNPDFAAGISKHPYLYARVLGIYHVNAFYTGDVALGGVRHLSPCRLECLWVRWYKIEEYDGDLPLTTLSFPPIDSQGSTSFIDPIVVLRAAHIVPRFHCGRVYEDGHGISDMAKDGSDWKQYYVNRFADRDMYMRYRIGMAVGHSDVWPEGTIRYVLPSQPQPTEVSGSSASADELRKSPHPGEFHALRLKRRVHFTAEPGEGNVSGRNGNEGVDEDDGDEEMDGPAVDMEEDGLSDEEGGGVESEGGDGSESEGSDASDAMAVDAGDEDESDFDQWDD